MVFPKISGTLSLSLFFVVVVVAKVLPNIAGHIRCVHVCRLLIFTMAYSWLWLWLWFSVALAPIQHTCSNGYKNNYFYCKFHYILSDVRGESLFGKWRSSHFA